MPRRLISAPGLCRLASLVSREALCCQPRVAVLLRPDPNGTSSLTPVFPAQGFQSRRPAEAGPSPILGARTPWRFCPSSAEGEVPLPPDGGQPTRAAVLKLSLTHPSKASNGHNNSYLQSAVAFTAWDPTGLYKRHKLIHTLTRRRPAPPPARQPPLGGAGAAVDPRAAPGHNGQAREGRMAGLWEAPRGPRPTHSACVILI